MSGSSRNALLVNNLGVDLGGRRILSEIALSATSGDAIALIGRNAAGKTTLLRAIAGILPPQEGEILVGGRSLRTLAPGMRAAQIAFVSQRPMVSAPFTVRDVIELGRFALPPRPDRVARAVSLLGLDALVDRRYHELSVGQQQRVVLGRALSQCGPDSLLLLDEPFAAMDLGEIDRCLEAVRGHAREGGVVIAVLHDLVQAAALANRVWMLEAGRVIDDGPPERLLDPERLSAWFGVAFERTATGAPVPRWGTTIGR